MNSGLGYEGFCRGAGRGRDLRTATASSSTRCCFGRRPACPGVWELIFKQLQTDFDDVGSIIDGTVVRAHQDASGGKRGSCAMFWAALVEGSPRSFTLSLIHKAEIHIALTPGNMHDSMMAEELIAHARGHSLIAGTRYDADRIVAAVRARQMKPVIHCNPTRKRRLNRKLCIRYPVEMFIHRIKRFRAVAKRYEKTARNDLALVQRVYAFVWLS